VARQLANAEVYSKRLTMPQAAEDGWQEPITALLDNLDTADQAEG
jgi:hypothetical protein